MIHDDFSTKPFVSVLLVTRNEKNYISKSLLSLVNQTYPRNRYEIIIVDGMSDDGSFELIKSLVDNYASQLYNIRIFQNEKRILSAGWNIGIKNAKGDYVVRIDAHAEASTDFIELNIETILKVNAVCVGGKLITKSLNGSNDIISKVLSSPFGVGNSSFRVSDVAEYTDTAVYGMYRKEIFYKVGFFNEFFVRNQDIEMHSRIKKCGGKIYYNPQIECIYYSRNTIKKMLKQALGNGKWNMVLLKKDCSALSVRHMVPFAFVLFLIISIVGGVVWRPIWAVTSGVLVLHLMLGTISALRKTTRINEILAMPFLFFLLHTAYGLGYFMGLFKKINKKENA
jgi:glycosyltransferase involved in cell wall biosynthesis